MNSKLSTLLQNYKAPKYSFENLQGVEIISRLNDLTKNNQGRHSRQFYFSKGLGDIEIIEYTRNENGWTNKRVDFGYGELDKAQCDPIGCFAEFTAQRNEGGHTTKFYYVAPTISLKKGQSNYWDNEPQTTRRRTNVYCFIPVDKLCPLIY